MPGISDNEFKARWVLLSLLCICLCPTFDLRANLSPAPRDMSSSTELPASDFASLERAVSHGVVQRPLSTEEEQTFPQLTQAGSHTDAYLEETRTGLVLAQEAEATPPAHIRSPSQSTLVSASFSHHGPSDPEKRVKESDVKLVTWLEGDPENPRNWGTGKKWCVDPPRLVVLSRIMSTPACKG